MSIDRRFGFIFATQLYKSPHETRFDLFEQTQTVERFCSNDSRVEQKNIRFSTYGHFLAR